MRACFFPLFWSRINIPDFTTDVLLQHMFSVVSCRRTSGPVKYIAVYRTMVMSDLFWSNVYKTYLDKGLEAWRKNLNQSAKSRLVYGKRYLSDEF